MFKKSKLALLCAFALTGLSSTSAVYADAARVKGETAALVDGNVVTSANPTFVFDYNPAMSGILVSLTEGLLASGDSTDDAALVNKCGTESETAFLGLSEMSCSSSGCDWIPSLTLKDGSSYKMNYEQVIAGVVDMDTTADCVDGTVDDGPVFVVNLGGTVTIPVTAPPEQVKIDMVEDEQCTTAIGSACVIKFTHNNSPAAASYRVWITDVNNIQIDEDKLTAKADQLLDINGWFDANGGSAYATDADGGMGAYVSCTPELDGSRDCKLNIHGDAAGGIVKHAVYGSMAAGKFKVWIRAWNAKGYALWSDSVVLDMHR